MRSSQSLDVAALKTEPIYRPISPVQILPAADAFADELSGILSRQLDEKAR